MDANNGYYGAAKLLFANVRIDEVVRFTKVIDRNRAATVRYRLQDLQEVQSTADLNPATLPTSVSALSQYELPNCLTNSKKCNHS